jgi:hypothetical protein
VHFVFSFLGGVGSRAVLLSFTELSVVKSSGKELGQGKAASSTIRSTPKSAEQTQHFSVMSCRFVPYIARLPFAELGHQRAMCGIKRVSLFAGLNVPPHPSFCGSWHRAFRSVAGPAELATLDALPY